MPLLDCATLEIESATHQGLPAHSSSLARPLNPEPELRLLPRAGVGSHCKADSQRSADVEPPRLLWGFARHSLLRFSDARRDPPILPKAQNRK